MKKLLSILTVTVCLLISLPADAQDIKVQIAPFYTEINYKSVDNCYVQYPLILYKDITYFPMTYDMCMELGLMSGYTAEDGLFITRRYTEDCSGEPVSLQPYGESASNSYSSRYNAVIPNYPIYLNGIRIYNDKEEYPLINFRDVTYFPMTYRFAHDELGFNIEWSDTDRTFKLSSENVYHGFYPIYIGEDGVKLVNCVDEYEDYYDESGNLGNKFIRRYYKNYFFDTEKKTLTRTEDTEKAESTQDVYAITPPTEPKKLNTSLNYNGGLVNETLYHLAQKFPLQGTLMSAERTDIGNNTSLIALYTTSGNAPAPYTEQEHYLFEAKFPSFISENNTYRQLDFDKLGNLSGVYDMGDKVYVASSGYRPLKSARWSNLFSDIYIYNKADGSFRSMVELNSDKFNSIRLVGITEGKLYVQAMWFNSNKSVSNLGSMPPFGAVNSGFYEIDVQTDSMNKLYPYINAECFVFPDGNLYAVANRLGTARLINLCTGDIYQFTE